MKKLLCLALSLMMILSVAVVPTVAATETVIDDSAFQSPNTIPTTAIDIETLKIEVSDTDGWSKVGYDYAAYSSATAFYIDSPEGLVTLSEITNIVGQSDAYRPRFQYKTIYLKNDIDMSGVDNFRPIADDTQNNITGTTDTNLFMGTFDGQGHRIKNLHISSNKEGNVNVALFGYVLQAKIQYLIIDSSCSFTYTGSSADARTAAVVARTQASGGVFTGLKDGVNQDTCVAIQYVKNEAPVTSNTFAGGIVGTGCWSTNAPILIRGCVNAGNIQGKTAASGIFGYSVGDNGRQISFENCTNTGNITATNGSAAGLYVNGRTAWDAKLLYIRDCTVSGTISGVDADPFYVAKFTNSSYINIDVTNTAPDVKLNFLDATVGYDYSAVEKVTKETLLEVEPITAITTSSKKTFKISTPAELQFLANYVNKGEGVTDVKSCMYGITVYLAGNLDMSGVEFTPIGNVEANYFSGTFDGQGYTIDNLTFTTTDCSYVGLFGNIRGATLRNVVLGSKCSFEYNGSGAAYTGALVGRTWNTAFSSAERTALGITSTAYIYSTISNCYSAANVASAGNAGGIVGDVHAAGGDNNRYSGLTVYNCTNVGNVTSDVVAGGIVGYCNRDIVLRHCRNAGVITLTAETAGITTGVGGICGSLNSGVERSATLKNSVNNGKIVGVGTVGGIVGNKLSRIAKVHGCTNYGVIESSGSNSASIIGWDQNSVAGSWSGNADKIGVNDTDWTSVKFVGVQTQKGADSYSVRFLATVNDLSVVTSAGFQIEITYGGNTKTVEPLYASYAYDSVFFEVENVKDTAYAGAYNGVYFISAVITDVPNGADVTFNVKTIANGVTAAEGASVTLNSGNEA